MLVIVMHNKRKYLEALVKVIKREGVNDATIIEKKDIGVSLIGMHASIIFLMENIFEVVLKGTPLNLPEKPLNFPCIS